MLIIGGHVLLEGDSAERRRLVLVGVPHLEHAEWLARPAGGEESKKGIRGARPPGASGAAL